MESHTGRCGDDKALMQAIERGIAHFDELRDHLLYHLDMVNKKIEVFDEKLDKTERFVKTKNIIQINEA